MKPIRNASLGLAVALLATVGFAGCSGSAQNQADSSFAQGSNPSSPSSSSSAKDFARPSSPASDSRSDRSRGFASERAPQPAPQPVAITIPRGTELRVSVDQTLSSATAQSGDAFDATLLSPVRADGQTIIPTNARVKGHVVDAKSSGRLSGVARLAITHPDRCSCADPVPVERASPKARSRDAIRLRPRQQLLQYLVREPYRYPHASHASWRQQPMRRPMEFAMEDWRPSA